MPQPVFKCILPLFERLSKEELLQKCLHGGTQNRNKAFHNTVWSVPPKVTYQNYETILAAVNFAVCKWNSGSVFIADLIKELKMNPGQHTSQFLKIHYEASVKNARFQSRETTKRRRTLLRSKNKKYADKLKEQEKQSYGAGCF